VNQALYEQAKANGATDRLAEMLAAQQAPGARTDREFFRAHSTLDAQFKVDRHLKHYVRQAKKAGYKPNINDVYLSQLARFPGDPEAFISGGRNQIRRVLEKRGWGCEGIVDVKPSQYQPEIPDIPLGADIIKETACEMVRENPDLAKKSKRELTEMVIDKHAPKKKRK
jgi:hypothetical protein